MKVKIDYYRTSVGTLQQCDVSGVTPEDPGYQKVLGKLGEHLRLLRGPNGRLDVAGTLELEI